MRSRDLNLLPVWIILSLLVFVAGCSPGQELAGELPFETRFDSIASFASDDVVTLTQSTVAWETYQYELTDFNTILAGSYDGETKVQTEFDTWVLENEYLRVTLLPEFGGRILSMIYKPTGHEELYQNPVGVPYQIDTNVFYHNWLMVYGGIFPTFPEPEHGKAWFYKWDFEIIQETEREVIVAMSYLDDSKNMFAPPQYNVGITDLKLTYYVRLLAGRAAVDTLVVIQNPTDETVKYEYWTNTTLAPGSDPDDPKTTSGAEIIAPVEMIKIPNYWRGIAAQEKPLGLIDVYEFRNLRFFENWSDMGIAYAFPDMQAGNFWGVINHDNQEGIFRIANNQFTPGMKIWTWGYPQTELLDPHASSLEARPYIELWAGVSHEFWQRAEMAPNHQLEIAETYSPSVGLDNVTHANQNFLVNLDTTDLASVEVEIFGLYPTQGVQVSLLLDGEVLESGSFVLDAVNGNRFSSDLPSVSSESLLELRIEDQDGTLLFSGTVPFSLDE
jgi:hypothetical protein